MPLSQGIIVAIATVTGAVALKYALGSSIIDAQFITFFPAVLLTAVFGGARGAFVALMLSAAAWWLLFAADAPGPVSGHVVAVSLFVVLAGVLVLAVDGMRNALSEVQNMRETLESRVMRRTEELRTSKSELEDLTGGLEKLVSRRTEELSKSKSLLTSVLEGIPDAVYLLDQQGDSLRFAYLNSAGEALLGHQRDEIIGKCDQDVINPAYALENREVIASGKPLWVDQRTVDTPAGSRFVEMRKLPLGINDGHAALLTIIRDVTDQRELQDTLRQRSRIDALGQLTGGIAHDFNNILAIAIGNLDLLEENLVLDRDAKEMLVSARNACLSGAELTGRLLAFARKQTLQPVPTDVNLLIGEYARLLERLLGADIVLKLDLAADVSMARVDKAQLEAAITNLATNARDAMPQGGNLTISTFNDTVDAAYASRYPELAPGPYVAVDVSDSGEGMSPEILEKAVEPFFTTKAEGHGTGLGLSMVFGFAKQSNGHVRIYSEPGHGTSVTLLLPRDEAGQTEKPKEMKPAANAKHGETVLVVDDNASLRGVAVSQLTSLGFTVFEAEDGPSALEVLGGAAQIDLLLTDIVMPGGLSGVDLGQAARQTRPDMKLIYMSGFPEGAFGDRANLDQGVTLLRKPFRKTDLASALRAALDQPS